MRQERCRPWGRTALLAVALGALPLAADAGEPEGEALPSGLLGWVGDGADGGAGAILDSLEFGGSVDVAYTFNWNNSKMATVENVGRVNDVFHNEFTVHNVVLDLRRQVNDEQLFGFAFTPTFGTDGTNVTAGGGFNFSGLNSLGVSSDLDVLEAHASLYVPSDIAILGGTEIKAGKFLTTAGAEVVRSGRNTMFSRSFLFGNAIPFTHTGVMAEKGVLQRADSEDLVSVGAGYANGWDSLRNTNDGHVFLTTATLAPQEWATFTANWFFGWADRTGVGDNNSIGHLVDLVGEFTVPVEGLEGLSLLLNFDWYGDENEPAGTGYADYYGFSGIVKWAFGNPFSATEDDQFYLAMRGEFVDDPDFFIAGSTGGNVLFMPGAGPVGGGGLTPVRVAAASQIWDVTWTAGYQPTDFMLVRLELRYDKGNAAIFEDGTRSSQTTMAVNTVFEF